MGVDNVTDYLLLPISYAQVGMVNLATSIDRDSSDFPLAGNT